MKSWREESCSSRREGVSKIGEKHSLTGGHTVVHAGQNAVWGRGEMVKTKLVPGNLKPDYGDWSPCFTGSREISPVFDQRGSIKKVVL